MDYRKSESVMRKNKLREVLLCVVAKVKTGLKWSEADELVEQGYCEWRSLKSLGEHKDGMRLIITAKGLEVINGI